MRTLKFRAWDLKNKEMVKVKSIDFDERGEVEEVNTSTYCWSDRFDTPNLGGIVLMQSTGLLDKNGVEIWESDIVHAIATLNKSIQFNCVVAWSAGGFIANGSLGVNHHTLEVIGNIYTHPHLLTPIEV